MFLGFSHRYLVVSDATMNVIFYSIIPSLLVPWDAIDLHMFTAVSSIMNGGDGV